MMWNLELGVVFGCPLVVIALGWWLNHRYDAELARDADDDADRLWLIAERTRDDEGTSVALLDAIWEMPARKATL